MAVYDDGHGIHSRGYCSRSFSYQSGQDGHNRASRIVLFALAA